MWWTHGTTVLAAEFRAGLSSRRDVPLSRVVIDFAKQTEDQRFGAVPTAGVMDMDGNFWVTMHGGGAVLCISPKGELIHVIKLPATNPTGLCWCGSDRSRLVVTTSRHGLSKEQRDEQPLAGHAFLIHTDTVGAPAYAVRG
jgi:sugar lactone lactonase YvrE